MKKKDENVKEALDEIFGDDFIELDAESLDNENAPLIDRAVFKDFELEEEQEEKLAENTVPTNNTKNISSNIQDKNILPAKDNIKTNHQKKIINTRMIILTIILIILVLIIGIGIYIGIFGIKRNTVCKLIASDTGYNFSDVYTITYQKNIIKKIKSTYIYNATDDEFKNQVKYVKESKIPVVINSNGISGFTYVVEENDELFKVDGYLDFEQINFKELDTQDFQLFPITYKKINSKTTYKSFVNSLKKEGYSCKNK